MEWHEHTHHPHPLYPGAHWLQPALWPSPVCLRGPDSRDERRGEEDEREGGGSASTPTTTRSH